MPYATQAEIEIAAGGAERLVQLADIDQDGTVDAAVLAQAQAHADGWIDSFARNRYATPIANPSATLKRVAAEEAVYYLRRARGPVSTDEREDHAERLRWCEGLARGSVRPDEPLPAKSTAIASAWVDRDPTGEETSREGLKGFW